MTSNLIHEWEAEGFTLRFYAEPEDESPRGQFQLDDGSDDDDLIAKIENGTYAWFCATVTASKAGVVLATDYLGCCCYESEAAFLTADGYAKDMESTVIREARKIIAKLNN